MDSCGTIMISSMSTLCPIAVYPITWTSRVHMSWLSKSRGCVVESVSPTKLNGKFSDCSKVSCSCYTNKKVKHI